MGYRTTAMALIALSFAAARVEAVPEVSIETFESLAAGTGDISIYNSAFMFSTNISDGTVVAETPQYPAHSGTQVYGGTAISLVTEAEPIFSWPGVGAWVSGAATIWLQAYEYDPMTQTDVPLTAVARFGGGTDTYLSIGSVWDPHFITKATFSSSSYFTLDDLTLGIEGIGPGIPEPASWAMMIGGLGMVGGAMRDRRRTTLRAV